MANLRVLVDKRAGLVAQARAILDKADQEKRMLSPEEETQWKRLMDDAAAVKAEIEREERMLEAESYGAPAGQNEGGSTAQRMGVRDSGPGGDGGPDGRGGAESRQALGRELDEYEASFENPRVRALASMRRRAMDAVGPREQRRRRMGAFRRFLGPWMLQEGLNSPEVRGLQADLDTAGGYLRPPEEFVNQIIMGVDNAVFIRRYANVLPPLTSPASLGVPTLEDDPSDPAMVTELSIGAEDTAMSFGKRALHPHKMAKYIKLSKDLVRFVPGVDSLVRNRLAYKFSIASENLFQNGTGNNEPLGVFTASNDGISTGRDVSTGNTATAITFDGLTGAKFGLKPQYRTRARWMFHTDAILMIAKIKDGNNNYIWRESVRVGEPDRLLNLPIDESAYTPNTFTASKYVGLLASWADGYWIVDAMSLEFQLLVELFAATDQVALSGKLYTDGMPVLEEAFVRVKLGA